MSTFEEVKDSLMSVDPTEDENRAEFSSDVRTLTTQSIKSKSQTDDDSEDEEGHQQPTSGSYDAMGTLSDRLSSNKEGSKVNFEEDDDQQEQSHVEEEEEGEEEIEEEEEEEMEEEEEGEEEEHFETSEEIIPIRIELKSGEWELRDQFFWSVVLPTDVFGQSLHAYIEYNTKDNRIDVFALRTVEDLDFPPGFDAALAKSIRAQIALAIPVIWKERQLINDSERRRRKLEKTARSTNDVIDNSSSTNPSTNNVQSNDFSENTDYPSNALKRLFGGLQPARNSHTTDLEKEDLTAPAGEINSRKRPRDEDQTNDEGYLSAASSEDLSDMELVIRKERKQKRNDLDERGRKKRKRGSAFEAHSLVDERIQIRLNLSLAGVQLKDQFEWDPSNPLYWADIWARRLALELGLPREFEVAISFEIRRQVLSYLASSSHNLPHDWSLSHSAHAAHIRGSNAQINNKDSVYFPTRSLPILNMQSVIRDPLSVDNFAPSLTSHTNSFARWEKDRTQLETRIQKRKAEQSAHQPTSQPIKPNPQTITR